MAAIHDWWPSAEIYGALHDCCGDISLSGDAFFVLREGERFSDLIVCVAYMLRGSCRTTLRKIKIN